MKTVNRTALESLADMVCRSEGARLVSVEQRHGQPTLVHFALDVSGGEPAIETLPITEFNSRAVRLALQKHSIDKEAS